MFLTRRPSPRQLEEFIVQSQDLPLSYKKIGIAKESPRVFRLDEARGVIGRGEQDFEQAKVALKEWGHFELGWVEQFPRGASIEPGTTVAIVARHCGFYSLNGCRVVYQVDESDLTFGFAYGTLTNHAEMGEEVFEVTFEFEPHQSRSPPWRKLDIR
jgi:uncharacterized protein (UPF0548 family)